MRAFVILVVLLFLSCEKKVEKKLTELNLVIESKITTLDPAKAFNDESLTLIGQVYEPLFQYHYLKRPYELIPLLAQKMPEISGDGKVYKIKIKQNVKYQPHPAFAGKDRFVKAKDFINQIKRLAFKPLKSTGKWLFENRLEGFDNFAEKVGSDFNKLLSMNISGLRAIDNHTLEFKFKKQESIILNFLAMTFVVPIPEEVLKYEKNNLNQVLVGTGPYQIEDVRENEYILKKYKGYREAFYPTSGDRYANTKDLISSSNEKIPFIDTVHFKVIEDADQRMNSFLNGELDLISVPSKFIQKYVGISGELVAELKEKGIQLKHFSSLSSDWLSFNMRDPLWAKNLKLRQAISHSIDIKKYISEITKNSNLKANSIYNPGIPGYNPTTSTPYSFDLDIAKKLLKEAGYPNAKGLPEITYSTRSDTELHKKLGEFVKEQLAQIGIKVKVNVLTFPEFLKKGRAGKLQLFIDKWIYDYPDAENLIQLLLSKNIPGINKSGYSNPEVDHLYKQYVTGDDEQKYQAMQKVQKIIFKDLPWIMFSYYSSYIFHYPEVKNYRRSSFIRNNIKYIKK